MGIFDMLILLEILFLIPKVDPQCVLSAFWPSGTLGVSSGLCRLQLVKHVFVAPEKPSQAELEGGKKSLRVFLTCTKHAQNTQKYGIIIYLHLAGGHVGKFICKHKWLRIGLIHKRKLVFFFFENFWCSDCILHVCQAVFFDRHMCHNKLTWEK